MHSASAAAPLLALACLWIGVVGSALGQLYCPQECSCYRSTVRCFGQNLVEVVRGIPPTTTILDLRFNHIRRLARDDFAHLPLLNTLLLSNNQLEEVEEGCFAKLPNLHTLYLDGNRLSRITEGTFEGAQHMKDLLLNRSMISSIDSRAFRSLPLQRLYLQDNELADFSFECLLPLRNLVSLRLPEELLICDCSHQALRQLFYYCPELKISPNTCHAPSKVQGIDLRTFATMEDACREPLAVKSPGAAVNAEEIDWMFLKCDDFVNDAMQEVLWSRNGQPVTSDGSHYELMADGVLKVMNISEMHEGVYECVIKDRNMVRRKRAYAYDRAPYDNRQRRTHGDRQVVIIEPPRSVDANVGDRVVLHCQANGYPRPFVQWTLNHHPISLSHRVRFQRDGTLTIDKVDVKDVGTYTCIAHNSRSQATASARVEVRVAPTFVAHPQNTITSEGAELRLLCEAKGYPQPSITWLKDGRPVQISQRFTMSLSNTLLTINPVLLHDKGTYICMASNGIGTISSKAIIEIRHTSSPKITLAPSTVSASVGGTVSFPCKAVGEPKPRITWSFNGMAIPTVVGHYEVSSQNTLYVNLVTKADAGHYMCQATNDVGSVSADATLYVLDDVGERQSPAIVDRDFIHSAVRQATQNVDRAINFTQEQLYSDKPKTPAELMALFKYPGPQAIQFARARDIYDETLSLVQAHVVRGLRFNVSGSYKYDDILSPAHVLMISELSGCDVPRERPTCSDICFHSKFRTYDGTCNNLQDTTRGASLTALKRLLPPAYENGFDMPIGWNKDFLYHGFKKPNPRVVSMSVVASERITDDSQYSHMLMQWGQFIDHDLSFTVQSPSVSQYQGGVNCARTCTNRPPCFNIDIPRNDPRIHDGICIEFQRSSAICGSGTSSVIYNHIQQRQQVNQITAYIDASSVYGSHEADALDLRDLFSDHGLMKFDITSHKQKPYLPFNRRFPMDCHRNTTLRHSVRCMMGGDYRANEQVGLLTMHTLFLREHNRIASELLKINPHWNGERLYQETRKIIGAEFQHITYAHWLPKILGPEGMRLLGDYNGYDPNADSGVYNEFATAAFRFGHSLIQPFITRLNASFMPHENGPLPLREAFFAPERMLEEGGLDPVLRGLIGSPSKLLKQDQFLNKELTERLFYKAFDVALDLGAMNIQRGRDHGIPGYAAYRRYCNLTVPESFDDMIGDVPNATLRRKLRDLYGHPDNIDLWVGGLSEIPLPSARVGPVLACIIAKQFKETRAGDRFWYENPGVFNSLQLTEIRKASLARAICDNGDEIDRAQPDVFVYVGHNIDSYVKCETLPAINLNMWQECCSDSCAADSQKVEFVDEEEETAEQPKVRMRRQARITNQPPDEWAYDKLAHLQKEILQEKRLTALEDMVNKLSRELQNVRESAAIGGKRKLGDNGCFINGTWRATGDEWSSDDHCTSCSCKDSKVWCNAVACPAIEESCRKLVKLPNSCCPVCL